MAKAKTVLAQAHDLARPAVAGGSALFGWYKFFREEPQPRDHRRPRDALQVRLDRRGARCRHSVLDLLRAAAHVSGQASRAGRLCVARRAWEQGQELPVGFTKKIIGFPRVANNCAVCHTASYRTKPDEKPTFVPAGPDHTPNVEAFFRFLVDCAKDPRFNADNLMREIELVTDLSWIDRDDLSLPPHPDHAEAAARARSSSSHGSTARIFPTGAAAATTR